jgi:agmatine/peptidylarginine deiminase
MEIKARLDELAVILSAHFKVKRLPMPLPYRGVFRTYANSLLVNNTAIVPRYHRYGWNYDDYPDAALAADYESKVAAIYREFGYDTRFVNADGLIFNGGAFHCVALQIPALSGVGRN